MAKKIPLSRGKFAVVDDWNYEWLNQWKWMALGRPDRRAWYAVRSGGYENGKQLNAIMMHRVILNLPDGIHADHIDGDGLNNLESNLRIATPAQNQYNSRSFTGSSQFKGVHWATRSSKWGGRIMKDRVSYHLGYFDDEIEAAKTYDRFAKRMFGEYARFNFPDDPELVFVEHELGWIPSRKITKTSQYRGVSRGQRNKKWAARISKNGKSYLIGYFTNEVEAALVYDKFAKMVFGNEAMLNFPDSLELGGIAHDPDWVPQRRRREPTSQYRGVCLTSRGRWMAQIGFKGKNISVGFFDSEIEAALAYNKKAVELLGDRATLNEID